MFGSSKTPAAALNEVTVTIQKQDTINYHETFLMDTTKDAKFEFEGFVYNIPAQDTLHYPPSFWRFDVKLAVFFEQHKTMASLFDWFNFRSKATYEIGYAYFEKNANPTSLDAPKEDWALYNYNLEKNSTVEGHYTAVDKKLRGKDSHMSLAMLIGALIIGIVLIVAVVGYMFGQPTAAPAVQNITQTSPLPILGGI